MRPVTILINGRPHQVPRGTVLAAAIAEALGPALRRSVSGQPRGPLCGMGVCMDCCVTVNGQPHVRSCLTLCEDAMEVRTNE